MKYVKKPIVVEAIKFTGDNADEISAMMDGNTKYSIVDGTLFMIYSPEGNTMGRVGDYLIKCPYGRVYICEGNVFEHIYEEYEENEADKLLEFVMGGKK